MIHRFDYAVSNPPYQQASPKKNPDAQRIRVVDIFPEFQQLSSTIADKTTLIYPATWQRKPQQNLALFLKDHGLVASEYYNGSRVFESIVSDFPLSVVQTDSTYTGDVKIDTLYRPRYEPVWIDHPAKSLLYDATKNMPKFSGARDVSNLQNIATSGLPFVENPEALTFPVTVYIKREPGTQADGGWYYVERSAIEPVLFDTTVLDQYSVSMPSSILNRMRFFNHQLYNRKTLGAKVFGINATHSQTYIQLRTFETLAEAEHFAKYVNSRFFHILSSFDFSKATFGSYVPDLEDYTSDNPNFDWDKPLDPQLYRFVGLSTEEAAMIEAFPEYLAKPEH